MCEDYRAGATYDFALDEADRGKRRDRLPAAGAVGRARRSWRSGTTCSAIWRDWADDVRGQAIDCGHFLPEEAPDATYAALHAFFAAVEEPKRARVERRDRDHLSSRLRSAPHAVNAMRAHSIPLPSWARSATRGTWRNAASILEARALPCRRPEPLDVGPRSAIHHRSARVSGESMIWIRAPTATRCKRGSHRTNART